MAKNSDLLHYHISIGQELESIKNRIRNLIGGKHWLTDGEHKEAVLRRVLRNHIPETIRVGTGFILYENGICSTQQDILITELNKPSLFKEGELTIVTPEAVRAIIEVKTTIRTRNELREIIKKLADTIENLRSSLNDRYFTAALFVFEKQTISRKDILITLQEVANKNPHRIIDYVTFGSDTFIKFDRDRKHWTAYNLEKLAQAYLVSNIVWRMAERNPRSMRFAWFPLKGGEKYRALYQVPLFQGAVISISPQENEEFIIDQ